MINSLLKEIGFTEKETRVYLALIELGTAKAADIAKQADILRPTTYDILKLLLKKGVVHKQKKGASTLYSALEPQRLLSYVDREIEDTRERLTRSKQALKEALPELMSRQNLNNTKPKVRFFEGAKGMREAYEETLTSRKEILAYANVETMHKGLPNFFPTYYQRRTDADVFIKAIMPPNDASLDRAKSDQKEKRQSRFLSETETFSPEINIFDDKVLVASWKEKMAFIIESKEFADFQRVIYERLWNSLPRK